MCCLIYYNQVEFISRQVLTAKKKSKEMEINFPIQQDKVCFSHLDVFIFDRLMVESEKNRRLMEEMNTSHKRIQSLESELSESKVNSGRPYDDINNLTRDSEKMIREIETLKRRCVGFQIQHIDVGSWYSNSLRTLSSLLTNFRIW